MRDGASLTDATAAMAAALGVPSRLLPATNDPVRTIVETDAGALDFQTYFVQRRQADAVRGLHFDGAGDARPSTLALGAIAEAQLLIIGPSNPLVSIGPILAIPGVQEALLSARARKIGVSGIVAGQAIRGPADRMMATLGYEPTARGVAALYAGLIDRFVIDRADEELAPAIEALGMEVSILPTVMRTPDDRAELARSVLSLA
jgi:LPPG:FO 2-phospho-L-lactate transferase